MISAGPATQPVRRPASLIPAAKPDTVPPLPIGQVVTPPGESFDAHGEATEAG